MNLIEKSLRVARYGIYEEQEDKLNKIRKLNNRLQTLRAQLKEVPDIKNPNTRQQRHANLTRAIAKVEDDIKNARMPG